MVQVMSNCVRMGPENVSLDSYYLRCCDYSKSCHSEFDIFFNWARNQAVHIVLLPVEYRNIDKCYE